MSMFLANHSTWIGKNSWICYAYLTFIRSTNEPMFKGFARERKKKWFFYIWFVLYKMKYISSLEPICRPWKIRTWSIDVNKESKSCYKKSMTLLITSCSSEVETIERIEWREQFGKSPLFLNEWTCTSYSADCERICWTCYRWNRR